MVAFLSPLTFLKVIAGICSQIFQVRVVSLRDLNITDFGKMDEYGSYRRRNSPLELFFNGKPLRLAQYPNDVY